MYECVVFCHKGERIPALFQGPRVQPLVSQQKLFSKSHAFGKLGGSKMPLLHPTKPPVFPNWNWQRSFFLLLPLHAWLGQSFPRLAPLLEEAASSFDV
jgi:hypothetical protein